VRNAENFLLANLADIVAKMSKRLLEIPVPLAVTGDNHRAYIANDAQGPRRGKRSQVVDKGRKRTSGLHYFDLSLKPTKKHCQTKKKMIQVLIETFAKMTLNMTVYNSYSI
tara:strand:- start:714 stop:1046 length:333 start_codon:yes stop_codon:yes gene_type:complete